MLLADNLGGALSGVLAIASILSIIPVIIIFALLKRIIIFWPFRLIIAIIVGLVISVFIIMTVFDTQIRQAMIIGLLTAIVTIPLIFIWLRRKMGDIHSNKIAATVIGSGLSVIAIVISLFVLFLI